MKFNYWNTLFIGFCFFGLGVLLWSVYHFYGLQSGSLTGPSFCNLDEYWNCDRVTLSKYGHVGGIPIGVFGAAWFIVVLIAGLSKSVSKKLHLLLMAPALLVCVALGGLLMFQLKAGCLVCYMSYVAWFGAAVSAWKMPKLELFALPAAGFGAGVAILLLVFFVSNQASTQKYSADSEEIQKFRVWFKSLKQENISYQSGLVKGSPAAEVTITEFSDFGCPHCAEAASRLVPFLSRLPNVKVEFNPLPFDGSCHPDVPAHVSRGTCDLAKLALCADKEGSFWSTHDYLFKSLQDNGRPPSLDAAISSLGLDSQKMKDCLAADETKEKLSKSIELARSLEIRGTPTFFVNGRRIQGLLENQLFKILVDEAKLIQSGVQGQN